MRYRGRSSIGFELGKFVFSELLSASHKSRWRIGNNIKICILCGKCEAVCPQSAISVSVHNKTWTLNNMRCNQCLNCIVRCPKRCLSQVSL
ncbi:MAG: 4Fe-4S binding protein [Methanobrevibacter sp.]|nr:4Fe-4S binding protein [Methanobrevibacter sp.]